MPGRAEPDKGEKLELLCDGQQLAVDGIHPDTHRPYSWHGGKPGEIKREDLPYLSEEDAHALVGDCAALLVNNFDYRLKGKPSRGQKPNGEGEDAGPADWSADYSDHDQLAAIAMKLVRSGMNPGAVKNFLRAQVSATIGVDPDRLRRRLNEISGMVDSAVSKLGEEASPQQPAPPLSALTEVAAAFNKWLVLKDLRPVYAVLGAVAANLMPGGDPVWLVIVAPPSTAKTEIINALSRVPHVRAADDISKPALLSGTPKHQKGRGATGGLLREVGDVVGLDAVGLAREEALELVEAVAMDGCPPLRRSAYFQLLRSDEEMTTRAVANAMGLPNNTARRVLEDLAAQGLALRRRGTKGAAEGEEEAAGGGEKKGGADYWSVNPDWAKSWD